MLIATPSQGSIHRNPNWVRTKPAPNRNIDARARVIATAMAVVPRQGFDRQLKIVDPTIADNAEVANPKFGKNEDSRLRQRLCPEVVDQSLPIGRQSCKVADADCQTTRRPRVD